MDKWNAIDFNFYIKSHATTGYMIKIVSNS